MLVERDELLGLPHMRRTKEDAAKTRREILSAAERLFLDNGYENVTLEHIAVSAGVTRGAIHWHFKNKQGLLFALRDEARFLFHALADSFAEDPASDPFAALARIISSQFQRLQADPRQRGVLRMMVHLDIGLSINGAAPEDKFKSEVQQSLIHIFGIAKKHKRLAPPWTPASAARSFISVVGGLVSEWALDNSDFSLHPDGMQIVHVVLNAFAGSIDTTVNVS